MFSFDTALVARIRFQPTVFWLWARPASTGDTPLNNMTKCYLPLFDQHNPHPNPQPHSASPNLGIDNAQKWAEVKP